MVAFFFDFLIDYVVRKSAKASISFFLGFSK